MKTDTEQDHFDEMTKYLTAEAKWFVLDGLACVFHNEGFSLQGNTEHNDALWLARIIWSREHPHRHHNDLEREPEEIQQRYTAIAEIAIKCLPQLAERIASRYIHISKAIRTIEKVARQQAARLKEKQQKRKARGR